MTQRAFLDVETSLTGKRWAGPTVEAFRLAEAMAQATRLPLGQAKAVHRRPCVRAQPPTGE